MKNRGFLNLSQTISALNLKSLSTVSELKELKFYRCVAILSGGRGLESLTSPLTYVTGGG